MSKRRQKPDPPPETVPPVEPPPPEPSDPGYTDDDVAKWKRGELSGTDEPQENDDSLN